MKVNEKAEPICTDNFFYDLFYGGYFNPEVFLVDKQMINDVNNAIQLIKKYKMALRDSGKMEEI
jgi:hypothetical protein